MRIQLHTYSQSHVITLHVLLADGVCVTIPERDHKTQFSKYSKRLDIRTQSQIAPTSDDVMPI